MYIDETAKMEAYFNDREKESFIDTIGILEKLIDKMIDYERRYIEYDNYDDDGYNAYSIVTIKDVKETLENIKEMNFIY